MQQPIDQPGLYSITASAAADAGAVFAPAALIIERFGSSFNPPCPARTLAIGTPKQVAEHPAWNNSETRRIDCHGSTLLPGLVNAHAHLDLTHIGPRPFDQRNGFAGWIDMIRAERALDDEQIASSVRRGIALAKAGGTAAIGDIAGAPRGRASLLPWRLLTQSGLSGASYLEFFAIGNRDRAFLEWLPRLLETAESSPFARVKIGLQPHAPNTVGLAGYRWAAEWAKRASLPFSTHLAESPEEREFIAEAIGPQRGLLESLNLWNDSVLREIGLGKHPVAHLRDVLTALRGHPCAAVHVNDADDTALRILAESECSPVYCPRASAYFQFEKTFGPHRYREMLDLGIPVALGTDSLVNLPESAALLPSEHPTGTGISILDEMRFLRRRDRTEPLTLLRMATINGARALGLPTEPFTFSPGQPLAGLLALYPRQGNQPAVGGANFEPWSILEADCPLSVLI